jgi:diacylglycerol kinase family enzyme
MATVLLNAGSGTGEAATAAVRVEARFRAAGRRAEIVLSRSEAELVREAERALGAPGATLVAGGGDGTVSTVANLVAGRDAVLGILPLGTLNHFARDLGLPLELDQAVDVILAGRTTAVDVGEVNGRVFLNNSSLGIYPLIVRLRQRNPSRGIRKWLVAAWATVRELRRNRRITITVHAEGGTATYRTPVALVANNEYRMAGMDAASRDSLVDGRLALCVARPLGRQWLPRLAWRILRGTAERSYELDTHRAERLTVAVRRRTVDVALDGEVLRLESPLEYRIRPRTLRVLVGADGQGPAPATAARECREAG